MRLQVTTVQQRQVFMPAQRMQASPSGPRLEGPHFAPPAPHNFLGMHNDAMQQTKQHRRRALRARVMAALETVLDRDNILSGLHAQQQLRFYHEANIQLGLKFVLQPCCSGA